MSSQSKLRFEPQGWVTIADCFYVLPIAAKYLGAKDPSQLQQSLCQGPWPSALPYPDQGVQVPSADTSQSHSQRDMTAATILLSSWMDHQTTQAAAAESVR